MTHSEGLLFMWLVVVLTLGHVTLLRWLSPSLVSDAVVLGLTLTAAGILFITLLFDDQRS